MTAAPPPPLGFTHADACAAADAWGANCGPGALAATIGTPLEHVRPLIPDFKAKRYTSPQMMRAAVGNAGWRIVAAIESHTRDTRAFPQHGLVRIQWEGPWYGRFAYHHTHWIASRIWGDAMWIFDINAGWALAPDWVERVAPMIIANVRRATGGWHATHRWSVAMSAEASTQP